MTPLQCPSWLMLDVHGDVTPTSPRRLEGPQCSGRLSSSAALTKQMIVYVIGYAVVHMHTVALFSLGGALVGSSVACLGRQAGSPWPTSCRRRPWAVLSSAVANGRVEMVVVAPWRRSTMPPMRPLRGAVGSTGTGQVWFLASPLRSSPSLARLPFWSAAPSTLLGVGVSPPDVAPLASDTPSSRSTAVPMRPVVVSVGGAGIVVWWCR